MSITRGEFLRSLGKSLPGMVASTGVATAAQALFKRVAQAMPPEQPVVAPSRHGEEVVSFLEHGPADTTAVALTFDDGPVPGVTERILDILRAHKIRATFFLIGEKVAAAPDLARRVLQEGHELGHHTYTHRKLTELPDAEVEDELDKTTAIFDEVFGPKNKPQWFRPPFGALRQDQARRVRARGMAVALWSVDAEDWREGPGEDVTERIVARIHPGAIVLCHDTRPEAESLDATLKRLAETSPFRLGTLSDLTRIAIP
jgi:peptidoglycan/xylan/chitin deacetylase (PgdA/CDA1 family)